MQGQQFVGRDWEAGTPNFVCGWFASLFYAHPPPLHSGMVHGAPSSICLGVSSGTQLFTGGARVQMKFLRAGGYAGTPLDAPVPTTHGGALRACSRSMYEPNASFSGLYAMGDKFSLFVSYEEKFICMHQCTTWTMESVAELGGRSKKNFPDANDLIGAEGPTAEGLEVVKKTYLRLYTSRLQLLRKCRELRKHNDELQRQLAVKHAMDFPRKEWGVALSDLDLLQVRLRELEAENAALRQSSGGHASERMSPDTTAAAAAAAELLLDAATIPTLGTDTFQ